MKGHESEFIPTRASLLSRLRDVEDDASWREFFETYWKLIYNVALRAGLTADEAHDVVQMTVIYVAKQLPTFRYDASKGSFKTWLYQITRWRILDFVRRRPDWVIKGPPAEEGPKTRVLENLQANDPTQPDEVWEEEWRKNLVDMALQRVRKRIRPKHYQIFDLYVVKEWPVADIQKALHVNRARIYLVKHRVSKLVREEVVVIEGQLETTNRDSVSNS